MNFTVAAAQIDSILGNLEANVRKHLEFIARARDGGADLVVFPELSLTGYSLKDMNWDAVVRADDDGAIAEIVRASGDISVLFGCVEESKEYGIFNSAFFAEGGKVKSVHRKIYPPTYGMFEELRYFSPGDTLRAFDASVGRLGVLICEDLWHLPLPYLLAQDGAQVIVGMAASPTRLSGEQAVENARVNSEQHHAYARLLSSYLVFCNRVGFEDGVNFWGGSEVVGPGGDTIVQAKLFDEDLVFAAVEGNEVRRARRFSRHFLDDDPGLVLHELRRIRSKKEE